MVKKSLLAVGFLIATILIAIILFVDWFFWVEGSIESKIVISILCPIWCYATIPITFYGLFEDF